MDRALSDWLDTYLYYCKGTEPPKSYHQWVGISLIAGALQRKVYIRWGHEAIYPNLYIVLVGPSGRTRKGHAMNMGIEIFKDLGIPTCAESITREALIRLMKTSATAFEDPSSKIPKFHCSITAFSKELSVFLGQKDIRFLADLTDWYDSHDRWAYETKTQGKDYIQGLCFNLLGATAQDWLQSMLPIEAIGGGFTSRIIFIVEDQKEQVVARPEYTEEHKKLQKVLASDLARITNIAGEYIFTEEAAVEYAQWYEKQESMMKEGKFAVSDPRFAGYCDRRATHVKKLALIFSASGDDERVIKLEDFAKARNVLEKAERNMAQVFGGLGKARTGDLVYTILQHLMKVKSTTRSELFKKFYTDIDTDTLEEVEKVILYIKVVEVKVNLKAL